MKKIYLISFIILIAKPLHISAQNEIIRIWNDTIPGAIATSDYEEIEIIKEGVLQSTSQVKTPSLSVYRPNNYKTNETAVLIIPGGGYDHLSMLKEGQKVALWLNSLGVTAFVLKYRLPDDRIMKNKSIGPLQDAQEAMRLIRRNAASWNINPDKIGVIGFSAGGHLAASLSTRYSENTYATKDSVSARPSFCLLLYPVISMTTELAHQGSRIHLLGTSVTPTAIEKSSNELHTNSNTPPTFLAHAGDDTSVSAENSISYYLALKKNKVAAELHVYEKGGHGFGLGVKGTSIHWTEDCIRWLKSCHYL